ncbi:hypothetical protein B194_0569 [Serratia plymuthica A30]|nr:hypothetical protein B194_0569 [Serratia plymuthica A30]
MGFNRPTGNISVVTTENVASPIENTANQGPGTLAGCPAAW